jgi:proline dehydrogenase
MLKTSLLRLSESNTAKKVITRAPISRSFAMRFVAGDTLDEALHAARALNDQGLSVSLDFLGESVKSREEATQAADMAVTIIESIVRDGLDANLSMKPTQLGLDIDEAFCRENIERVLGRARELGDGEGEIFVRLDMESSAYTERTVAMVEALWADGFRNVGTVLQSMLRRTGDDVERMLALGARVRLVKGAYQEPESVAFPDKADTDRAYVDQMKRLLESPPSPRTTRRSSTRRGASSGSGGSPRSPSSSRCCTACAATCRRGCARRGTTSASTSPSAIRGTRT